MMSTLDIYPAMGGQGGHPLRGCTTAVTTLDIGTRDG